ncbi:unnamed protein product [Ilex paraguariensis]|uniref:Uncharacterized protein n=1 Tax=Ilex paraguariensis TaxID=185542 RepID=A0ABC8SCL7_9AQUA
MFGFIVLNAFQFCPIPAVNFTFPARKHPFLTKEKASSEIRLLEPDLISDTNNQMGYLQELIQEKMRLETGSEIQITLKEPRSGSHLIQPF